MKGYLISCLLAFFMIVSISAGPNQSKCIKDEAAVVKGTEKEATEDEVRDLLHTKNLPNELVDMILDAARRLPRPWKPIAEGIRHRKKSTIRLAKACDAEVVKASGSDLHGPRKRRPQG